jgi:hypothetical protein
MRITNSGNYESCRWQTRQQNHTEENHNIKTISPLAYFQNNMSGLRSQLLDGQSPNICTDCQLKEQYNKVSGRQRQLLKVGVREEYFEKSLASSPMKASFDYSYANQGHTTKTVTDWQIDLGNYCNGACVFCEPKNSSKLAVEFKKIGLIDQMPPPNWCDDPALLNSFIEDLKQTNDLHYLHFLGGETLITSGFKKILSALVESDLASNASIGFTTNLMVWDESINELLKQFKQVHLGMSIETLTALNDYVRYPSKIGVVRDILDQWVVLGTQLQWFMQLRITPTCLTVHELTTIYDYAWQHKLATESCNFIDNPKHLRINVLPQDQREKAHEAIAQWIKAHQITESNKIINTRHPNFVDAQIIQDADSYLNYLKSSQDESYRLPELVSYLKKLVSNRKNTILDYLPQYEQLFRSQGY